MANIRDVAKAAGVSVATVSRYLNNKGYISEEAKRVIAKAVDELNYQPSMIARSLSTKQSTFIGLIVPDIVNPFFPELARAIEDVALAYGYTLILCNSDEDLEKEINYVKTLQQKYVAGFIVASNHVEAEHYMGLDIPIVAIDRRIHSSIPYIATDNREGARIGTEHLLDSGCRNILCMRGPSGLGPADDRFAGFMDAVKGKNIETHIIECPFHFDIAETMVKKILQEVSIDGIFASSDVTAAGAMKAAYSAGIHVPNQLQIVGYDGTMLASQLTPGLTTVAQDLYRMGAMAAKMLIELIKGQELTEREVLIPAELLIRQTTRSEA
ncbi:transcriptional regulator [Sporosarcina sp. P12(2017)]|uniref:LacI family DNA-binding transcriptional regulator n=1 Tax=unclassified Sporosarcina TaxID=2647733 RepID=UPI000C16561F|nr:MULTISPECIES: LacI family DNA-binding transcriptional regulator [unclassified Sporosarcina]PIC58348.1 transcriptional regulator [Sporosarcina sp. P10]PIC61487.1 transcriptional regulator [Sporosarcina sp. P12(2017)]